MKFHVSKEDLKYKKTPRVHVCMRSHPNHPPSSLPIFSKSQSISYNLRPTIPIMTLPSFGKMNFFIVNALLVTGVMSSSAAKLAYGDRAESKMNLAIRDAPHQGDGLYIAHTNEKGDYVVDFTPWKELKPVPSKVSEYYNNATAAAEAKLGSRDSKVTCSGKSGNKDLLKVANEAAAHNAEDHGLYPAGSTGWVSILCNV
jgi:hypothetical protein